MNVSDKNIVICMLARDCARSITKNIPKIERLRSFFKNTAVVIIENDSKDNTKEVLRNWEQNSVGVKSILQDFGTLTIASSEDREMRSYNRIEKMATYRNMYIGYIENNINFPIDYVIVIDIDILDFDIIGIIKTIEEAPNNWGGLFANGTQKLSLFGRVISRRQYDLFAFKEREDSIITPYEMFQQKRKLDRMIDKTSYLNCFSAFGGIGIYKWDAIKGLKYAAEKNPNSEGEYMAEHIPFHKGIINRGYSNYISKKLKVDYGEGPLKMFIRVFFP
ncbi:hypothetical protein [Capnocytophaga leadbetteri]|jgi:hypothetical protein|uniref:hypothetical protein n=2 Tax=Capnocytophaga TaxID=1016 RepID=UPI0028E2CC18|nr:hypothetical protein [Capnocytophaga leadbetteri]